VAPLAGQRATVRLDGPVAHVLVNGTIVRTVACPVPQAVRLWRPPLMLARSRQLMSNSLPSGSLSATA
jgi:hypothetical protein